MNLISSAGLMLSCLWVSGCAVLHHVQIGDIDASGGRKSSKIDIKVSETGINIKEAGEIAKALSASKEGREAADTITTIISMFQMGPHTGNGVFSDAYAEDILQKIYEQCPTGHVTQLESIRETRKYPVVSGEIVNVQGLCLL